MSAKLIEIPTDFVTNKKLMTKFVFESLSPKEQTKCFGLVTAKRFVEGPITLDEAMAAWWQNKADMASNFMLTKFGVRAFKLAKIKTYQVDVITKITPSVLKKLQLTFAQPFYIENFVTNTALYLSHKVEHNATIYLFSEKDYVLLTLYNNDLTKLLEHSTS
jgi:hypothetical protein